MRNHSAGAVGAGFTVGVGVKFSDDGDDDETFTQCTTLFIQMLNWILGELHRHLWVQEFIFPHTSK